MSIVEVHPLPNGKSKPNGKGNLRVQGGEAGFNMMRVPQGPSQKVVSQNIHNGETIREIGGKKFVCVSAGHLLLGSGGLGSTLGPNHSFTISSIRGSGPRDG